MASLVTRQWVTNTLPNTLDRISFWKPVVKVPESQSAFVFMSGTLPPLLMKDSLNCLLCFCFFFPSLFFSINCISCSWHWVSSQISKQCVTVGLGLKACLKLRFQMYCLFWPLTCFPSGFLPLKLAHNPSVFSISTHLVDNSACNNSFWHESLKIVEYLLVLGNVDDL